MIDCIGNGGTSISLPRVKQVAQTVKNPPAMRETWVRSLNWDPGSIPGLGPGFDPLEKGMAAHSSTLAPRNSMDRGGWWFIVHGISKSQTLPSD